MADVGLICVGSYGICFWGFICVDDVVCLVLLRCALDLLQFNVWVRSCFVFGLIGVVWICFCIRFFI